MKPTIALAVLLCGSGVAAGSEVRIPFEMTGYHAFVRVELKGEVLSFVFDTAANGVAINETVARRLGLQSTGSAWINGASGGATVPVFDGLTLRLGGLELNRVMAAEVPLDHLEEMVGRPIDGIIGRSVLDGRVVLIDHEREVIEVHDGGSFSFEGWGEPCPIEVAGAIELPGTIELLSGELLSGPFVVDSGAWGFIVIDATFARAHDVAGRVGHTYARKGRGLTSIVYENRMGSIAGVEFCGYRFPTAAMKRSNVTLPVLLSGARAGSLALAGKAGLIGHAILERFNIVFDLARGRIYVRPNAAWEDPVRSDASGLHLLRLADGRVVVDAVVPGSPAERAGLAIDDELRSIDGTDIATIALATLRERLREPGRVVSLVVVHGGESRTAEVRLRSLLGERAGGSPQ